MDRTVTTHVINVDMVHALICEMDAFVTLVILESYAKIAVLQIHMVRTAKPLANAVTVVNAIMWMVHVNVHLVSEESSVKTVVRRGIGASHHVRKDARWGNYSVINYCQGIVTIFMTVIVLEEVKYHNQLLIISIITL